MGLDVYTLARLFIERNQFFVRKKSFVNHVSCFSLQNILTAVLGELGVCVKEKDLSICSTPSTLGVLALGGSRKPKPSPWRGRLLLRWVCVRQTRVMPDPQISSEFISFGVSYQSRTNPQEFLELSHRDVSVLLRSFNVYR